MANQLKMAMVNAIWTLKQRGWSNRRIARELGIDRETVARYVHIWESDSKPATNAPTGSEGVKPAVNTPIGSIGKDTQKPGPESQCEPFHEVIGDKLQGGLSRQRIYQDLRDEYGFEGSYYSVRRFVKRLDVGTG
jgi:IS30 family transposase